MTKKKLIHFAENLTFAHLFQKSYQELKAGFELQGNWQKGFFENNNPVVLELGCGKGEYTVNLARVNPERNFIGIDIKGARLWKGCKMVQEEGLKNVAFIRTRVDWIEMLFGPGEADEIWITFPDPQPQSGRVDKRLTSPVFIDRYREILAPGGLIHLKTDNEFLFRFTMGVIRNLRLELVYETENLYESDPGHVAASVQTFYEEKYLRAGIPIKYLEFRLPHENR